jgi:Arrestin (or S-antigen), C-terminal domain
MVIRPVDLNNENPCLRLPNQRKFVKRFCCWPCRSAPLMLTAQIPMSGYAPGQTINIAGELNNKSSVTVHAIHFALKKTVTYISDTPSTKEKIDVLEIITVATTDRITSGCTVFNVPLLIPAVAPTNLTQSKVIHQTYELIVEARVSRCLRNPKVSMPITIGTVPLRQLPESPLTNGPGPEGQPFLFPTPAAPPLDDNWQENTNFLELREFFSIVEIM